MELTRQEAKQLLLDAVAKVELVQNYLDYDRHDSIGNGLGDGVANLKNCIHDLQYKGD